MRQTIATIAARNPPFGYANGISNRVGKKNENVNFLIQMK
jgi:hypothetical protein